MQTRRVAHGHAHARMHLGVEDSWPTIRVWGFLLLCRGDLFLIYADLHALHPAVLILADDAVKYPPPGGFVGPSHVTRAGSPVF